MGTRQRKPAVKEKVLISSIDAVSPIEGVQKRRKSKHVIHACCAATLGIAALSLLPKINKPALHTDIITLKSNTQITEYKPLYIEEERHCNGFECFMTQQSNISGDAVRCPCCGSFMNHFDDTHGPWPKKKEICPVCKAVGRHRHSCFNVGYGIAPIHNHTSFKLLHFGPHKQMARILNTALGKNHFKVDFLAEGYSYEDVQFADVTQLNKAWSGKFDGIINLHVMEHVPNLMQGLRELRRVLSKPNGWLLMEAPCTHRYKTHTCFNMTADEMTKKCGQYDHVWAFNCGDFLSKLKDAGFSCEVPGTTLPKEIISYYTYDLPSSDSLATKNHVQWLCT